MNLADFRTAYIHCVALIIKYKQNVQHLPLMPKESPGYFRKLLPEKAPNEPESFYDVLKDLEEIIIPNLLHWNHPNFFAYFACAAGYPSILAEILIAGLGSTAFSWGMCPGLSEIDHIATDMFGRLLNLPKFFLYADSNGTGSGMMMNSASEGIYLAMLCARNLALKALQAKNGSKNLFDNIDRLVAYCSKEAHSCVEKASLLQLVKIRLIDVNEPDYAMDLKKLEQSLQDDKSAGLYPFFVLTCFGSTGTAAMDNLDKLEILLNQWPDVWYHLDGAYGGSSFMLPEYQAYTTKLGRLNSCNVNPYKWALAAPCGSVFWAKNRRLIEETIATDMKYLNTEPLASGIEIQSMTITRKLRGLRLYISMRAYGKSGMQRYLKNHIFLTKRFEDYIIKDPIFVQVGRAYFSLACFRMKEIENATSEQLTKELIGRLNDSRKMHLTPSYENNVFFIRFCVTYEKATKDIVDNAYRYIRTEAEKILADLDFKDYPPISSFVRTSDSQRRSIDFDSVILAAPPRRNSS